MIKRFTGFILVLLLCIATALGLCASAAPADGAFFAEAAGFSRYTVEFRYGGREYVLPGDSSAPLSGILTALGLNGEVTAAEVSDAGLFSVSDESGEWIVTAHRAFDTTERMTVTIGGTAYVITVTDELMYITYTEYSWDGSKLVSTTNYAEKPKLLYSESAELPAGTYYVDWKNLSVETRYVLQGNVTLVLSDGAKYTCGGFVVPSGATLKIVAEGSGTGKLVCNAPHGAAIGGDSGKDNGNIEIHGGVVEAYGHKNCAGIGSNDSRKGGSITIYGGTVTARGGENGAAIGGGKNCSGGNITIYGGKITANGPTESECPENGAGIGGGDSGSGGTITIRGGTVTAYSRDGAGIGGGDDGDGGNITIHGGTITSTKVNQGQGARIGGGCDAAPGTIVIDGGEVTTAGGSGAGIGGGKRNTGGGSVAIRGGVIKASGSYGIGSGEDGADVPVTLDYTDATWGISVTASSFTGTVTIGKPFVRIPAYDPIFMPGVVTDNSKLTDGELRPWNVSSDTIDYWWQLQSTINGASAGDTIRLDRDLTAEAQNSALTVSSDKNITLDLNGHTLDRGLTASGAAANGYVIKNEGTLTITDSRGGGRITGGNCSGTGGGIYNQGTLTLSGGSITGNKAGTWGGGIYLPDNTGAVLNLNGGSVTNNTCGSNGGGVHVSGTASMRISGSPAVSGNTKNGAANNINLAANAVMQVSGALTENADLNVSISSGKGTLTSGYGAIHGTTYPGAFFRTDKTNYVIALANGEAKIDTPHTVSVDAADAGRIKVDRTSAPQGYTVTVTILDNTDPGMINVIWKDGSVTHHTPFTAGAGKTGTFIMPGADATVKINPPVQYYCDKEKKTYNGNYTLVTPEETQWISGWYVVNEDVTINQRIEVKGNVKLVLLGTSASSYSSLDANAGIHVAGDYSLTIYGETENFGTLTAGTITYKVPDKCAAIGGNRTENSGAITVNSGTVAALSQSWGAGIGGGDQGSGQNITINGGKVLAFNTCAQEARGGAAIGGGMGVSTKPFTSGGPGDGRAIVINGGYVAAWAFNGAGIGGGCAGSGYNIRINDGSVFAISYSGAAIGGGQYGAGFDITVNGGTVDAESMSGGAGIGSGVFSEKMFPGNETSLANAMGGKVAIDIRGGTVTASSGYLAHQKAGQCNTAFVFSTSGQPQIPLGIYEGAKITGGYSENPTKIVTTKDILNKYLNYVKIEPCTHKNATWEITATTHKRVCPDCHTTFTAENHVYNNSGVCSVCGYDSQKCSVVFDSNGGSKVTAQMVTTGGKATVPDPAPTREGYFFDNWYKVTNGVMDTNAFDFSTSITENITLKARWLHKHGETIFLPWDYADSLPATAGNYYLTQDVTLTSGWVWSSGTMHLCLDGHTIDGNGKTDSVITVSGGILNLYDEKGGVITGSTDTGISVAAGSTFSITGNMQITGSGKRNVYLAEGAKLTVAGALDESTRIGVSMETGTGVFTSGLSGKGTTANFFSDDNKYAVSKIESGDNAGELELAGATTITFAPGNENAEGYMPEQRVATGSSYILPGCAYTLEEMDFAGWSVQIGDAAPVNKNPNDPITVIADTTVTATWADPAKVETPTANPAGGSDYVRTVVTVVNVALNCATEGAEIWYTTDGSDPTNTVIDPATATLPDGTEIPAVSSQKYSGPIPVTETTTLRARAFKEGMTQSEIAEAVYTFIEPDYTLEVTAPEFSPLKPGYTQPDAQPLTITSKGNTASTISAVALSGDQAASFVLYGTAEERAIEAGSTNTFYTLQPAAGLATGIYTAVVTVTYDGGATAEAEVSFTVLGTKVEITAGGGMLKAGNSGDASQTMLTGAMTDVVYAAESGYYFPETYGMEPVNGIRVTRDSFTQITVSGTPDKDTVIVLPDATEKAKPEPPAEPAATACTTADNNDGTLTGVTAAMEYRKAGEESWTAGTGETITGLAPGIYEVRYRETETTLASDSLALAVSGYINPNQTAAPVFSPEAGVYTEAQTVTLSCTTEGAKIHYTTDGTDPTKDSTEYTGPISVTETVTIKAIAVFEGMTDSAIASAAYTIIAPGTVAPPAFSPEAGEYTGAQTVTISCTTEGAKIHYTTDGTEPTKDSTVYTGAISVTETMTLKAIAVFEGMTDSAIASATYQITIPGLTEAAIAEAPAGKLLIYSGEAQELVTAGKTDEGTMQYALGTDEKTAPAASAFAPFIPTAADIGTYYVWYKVIGDENHNDTKPACVTASILPVNRDSLNTLIPEAEDYRDHIKEKHPDIAGNLEAAISEAKKTAENPNAKTGEIAEEIRKLTEALDKAKKAVKDAEDQAAAKAVKDLIDALPDPDKVTEGNRTAIEAARKAYDALTEDQKKLISEETLKKLEDDEAALNRKPIAYTVTEGAGAEYKQGSDGTLTFVFKRSEKDEETFSHFAGMKYDGKALTRDRDYTARAGSVIVTLDHNLLESMNAGSHILTAMFDDGEANAVFTVIAGDGTTPTPEPTVTPTATPTAKPVPKTGDNSNPVLWLALMILGLAVLAGAAVRGYRKR